MGTDYGDRHELPELFAEGYLEILRLLGEADVHSAHREAYLEDATRYACEFLWTIMDSGPFLTVLKTVEGMSPDEAAGVLSDVTGRGLDKFLLAEMQLLIEARIPSSISERLIDECRDAIGHADPQLITGGAAIEAFLRLRRTTCDLADRQLRRNYEFDREEGARIRRAIGKGVGGVVVGTVDFAVLGNLPIPPLFEKASALASSAMVNIADALFHRRRDGHYHPDPP